MRGLQSTCTASRSARFSPYKAKLIDYLENFISERIGTTSRIAEALLQLEACGDPLP